MGIQWEWEHKYAKMGMGMGRVHVTMGMGMATFSCVPKFPSVDTMRMQANKILKRLFLVTCDHKVQLISSIDYSVINVVH